MSRPQRWGCGVGCAVAVLVAVLLALLAIGGMYAYLKWVGQGNTQPYHNAPDYNTPGWSNWGESVEIEPQPPDTALPDFTAKVREMQVANSDTVGWLHIPDTTVDFPILYTPLINDMNNRYITTNFEGEQSKLGACFASKRSYFGGGARNELAPMTTLYAHSYSEDPADSSLFSALKFYRDEQFAREHPYVYFSTLQENMAFEVIAVFEAHVNLPYNHYKQPASNFNEMLDAVAQSSLYDYGMDVRQTDRLLVLSTCAMTVQGHEELSPYTTEYRFVVMGKLVPPGEATKTEAIFTKNPSPAPPDNFLHMGSNG